ncbi:lysozyme inhibitor LprI family protein [Dongia sp.]|uniref:lysozyme inhibitor LprI family protein n=1 Tax=Dongia sp. TaxID=1977262 RepID=UPI0037512A1B
MARDLFLSEAVLAKANDEALATMDDPQERVAFTEAANAWCGYREAICNREPSAQVGGSMSGQLSSQCRRERNESHANILRKWIDCVTNGGCENPPLFFKLDKP